MSEDSSLAAFPRGSGEAMGPSESEWVWPGRPLSA